MKHLYAFYENKKIGVLTLSGDDIYSFEYDAQWRDDPESFAISLAMPLEQKSFGHKITLSFFENLLPEGEVLRHLEQFHKVKGPFQFLEEFGQDCAGAIVLSKTEFPSDSKGPEKLTPVDMPLIYKAIDEHQSVAELISEVSPGYLSLAGAQDKFAAIYQDEKLYLPKNGEATTHIVKVPILRSGIKESVYNEYFCMELAGKVGLDAAHCQVIEGPHPLLLVERYDRYFDGKRTRRLHQQDFCQAQGAVSSRKYEITGGPTLKENYLLLKENVSSKSRLEGLTRFLDWVCFNLIIGNNDSHSKNISLLLAQDRKHKLAPFYDLISTAMYPKLQSDFSFLIGDQSDFSKIGKKQFQAIEGQLGLKEGMLRTRISGLVERIMGARDLLVQDIQHTYPHAKIVPRICKLMDDRIKSLRLQKVLD